MSIDLKQVLPVTITSVVWFDPIAIKALEIYRKFPEAFISRFAGDPTFFPPLVEAAPLFSAKLDGGELAFVLSRSSAQLTWNRRIEDGSQHPEKTSALAETVDQIVSAIRSTSGFRLRRLAAVAHNVYRTDEAAKFLANRFCDPKWKGVADQPGTDFQIHFHDITDVGGLRTNRWVRFNSAQEAHSKMNILVIETDLNTREELDPAGLQKNNLPAMFLKESEKFSQKRVQELLA